MSYDPIDYQQIMHLALRGVVRRTLDIVVEEGLPPGHFFYITFLTQVPGVEIAKELVDIYPDDMTIIIQNQYWDLEVGEDAFSIGLSFASVPRYLTIPYEAVVSFVDPPAEFGLRFAPPPGFEDFDEGDGEEHDEAAAGETGVDEDDEDDDTSLTRGKVVSLDAFRKR